MSCGPGLGFSTLPRIKALRQQRRQRRRGALYRRLRPPDGVQQATPSYTPARPPGALVADDGRRGRCCGNGSPRADPEPARRPDLLAGGRAKLALLGFESPWLCLPPLSPLRPPGGVSIIETFRGPLLGAPSL